jgi:uncharacterized membrane-anchored protein YhcB (DUF1043 family)
LDWQIWTIVLVGLVIGIALVICLWRFYIWKFRKKKRPGQNDLQRPSQGQERVEFQALREEVEPGNLF